MVVIELNGLSASEAEEALVEIWSCLEEYVIPSPRIVFAFRADNDVDMEISIEEPLWAEMVTARLSRWLGAGQEQARPMLTDARLATRATRQGLGSVASGGPQAKTARMLSDLYFPATREHDLILHVKRR